MPDNYVAIKVRAEDEAKPDLTDLKARLEELSGKVATARAEVKDADADATLTDLEAKLEAIGKKVASPKIDMAGAARALAQLTAVDAAMDHLDDKPGEDGERDGRAWGERFRGAAGGPLNDLSGQLGGSGLGKEAEKAGSEDGGFFHNSLVNTVIGGLAGTLAAGVSSALAVLPALGAVAGVGMVAGLGAVVADKIPAVGAQFSALGKSVMGTLESAVRPMVPFLEQAAKQLGGFAKSIGPELSAMFKAVGPMIGPLLQGLESLVKGLLPGLAAIIKGAMPAVTAFAQALGGLGKNLGGLFASMAPAVSASAQALKALFSIIGGLLPVIGQVAGTMATLLAPVLTQLAGLFRGMAPLIADLGKIVGEFAQAFLVNLAGGMQAVIGLVRALAPAFGTLAGVLGQVFSLMNNRGVFNDIEDAIEDLVGPIGRLVSALVSGLAPVVGPIISVLGKLAGILQGVLVGAVAAVTPVLVRLARFAGSLLEAMLPLLPAIVTVAQSLAGALMQSLTAMLPAVSAVLTALTPLIPVISVVASVIADVLADGLAAVIPLMARAAIVIGAIVGAVRLWAVAQGILDVVMSANPLGVAVIALVALIGVIVEVVKHWRDIATAARDAFALLKSAVSDVVGFVRAHWQLLATILATMLLGPIGGLVVFIATHWRQIAHDTEALAGDVTRTVSRLASDVARWFESMFDWVVGTESRGIDRVISFFRSLPGRILSALGDVGTMLYNAGRKIIGGLASGLKSAIGDVTGAVGGIAGEIIHHFPLSPAKKGPLSGAGDPVIAGRKIGLRLTQGLRSSVPDITSTMDRVAASAGLSGRALGPGGGGYGAAQQLDITIKFEGDGALTTAIGNSMRVYVRERGGGGKYSAQKALGRVWPT